jgi:hypothetical protein
MMPSLTILFPLLIFFSIIMLYLYYIKSKYHSYLFIPQVDISIKLLRDLFLLPMTQLLINRSILDSKILFALYLNNSKLSLF